MVYDIDHIAATLKAAREGKGLSQRALAQKAGVPQGHISKIENGAVDLRLSSLIALARALDLELTLVPRRVVPAVRSIARTNSPDTLADVEAAQDALRSLRSLQKVLASTARNYPAIVELAQLQRFARDLERFRLPVSALDVLKKASKTAQVFKNGAEHLNALRRSLSEIRRLRNALAHGSAARTLTEAVRPAYSLEEDDGG